MIEHERSYIFTHDSAHKFLADQGMSLSLRPSITIEDYYLRKGMRVRKSWKEEGEDIRHKLTRKTGDKSKGYRFEFEEEISQGVAEALIPSATMTVRKVRKKLPISDDAIAVTMDFVNEPMKIAIMEVEALNEVVYPVPADITNRLFGVSLLECPLCCFTLFNRHVGICGGPSSGKSETAKILSHILNTQYGANAYHVAEFATTFIQKYHKAPTFWEEFFIWHGQHEREHAAAAADIIFSDSPTFLTYIYLLYLPKDSFSADTALVLSKMYKRVLADISWYTDIIFLKVKDYKQNRIRYQTSEEAMEVERRIEQFMRDHNICHKVYTYDEISQILKDIFYINGEL